jgi:hypothetical protein
MLFKRLAVQALCCSSIFKSIVLMFKRFAVQSFSCSSVLLFKALCCSSIFAVQAFSNQAFCCVSLFNRLAVQAFFLFKQFSNQALCCSSVLMLKQFSNQAFCISCVLQFVRFKLRAFCSSCRREGVSWAHSQYPVCRPGILTHAHFVLSRFPLSIPRGRKKIIADLLLTHWISGLLESESVTK